MNKKICYVLILIISVFFISCDIQFFTPGPYHIIEWACIMNSDGTELEYLYEIDVEEMYFPNGAKFTQDNQKIIFGSPEGIFTRDFTGNIEKISNLKKDEFSFYSSDLEYMYHLENNDIYRMNFDGTEKINLTNTPDEIKSEAFLSNDNQHITYVVEVDTLYTLCKIDINGDNLQEIYESTLPLRYPKYNSLDENIYFANSNDLLSININTCEIYILEEHYNLSSVFQISSFGNTIVYSRFCESSYELISKDLALLELNIIKEHFNALGNFSSNSDGNKIVFGGSSTATQIYIQNIKLDIMQELVKGINPFISPNGEKIFFTKGVEALRNIE